MSRRAALGAVLAAVFLLVVATGARAAEFTVNATGDHAADACDATDCTVRDAIAAANAATGADTITVPAGTYALSFGALVITGPVTISGPSTAQPTAILDAASATGSSMSRRPRVPSRSRTCGSRAGSPPTSPAAPACSSAAAR